MEKFVYAYEMGARWRALRWFQERAKGREVRRDGRDSEEDRG